MLVSAVEVVDVVLGGDGEDPQVHVLRTEGSELERVEREHVRDVELREIAANALLLPGDGVGADRIGGNARHRDLQLANARAYLVAPPSESA